MATLTVENYAKAIFQVASQSKTGSASTGELARRLDVSPGTVTSMLRTLSESGLAEYQAYEGVRLSDAGRRLALRVIRRHRLVELFLARTLGLTWDEVHEEAEHLEHAVSDRLVDRIDHFLDYPQSDPHGDPIPKPDGTMQTQASEPMAGCTVGSRLRLVQVLDQSPEFLRYLGQGGLSIGATVEIIENHPSAGAVTVRSEQRDLSLSRDLALKVLVVHVL